LNIIKLHNCVVENVTQIKLRVPLGGHPNGVKHERKKAVTKEYKPSYQKASKKEKRFCWMNSPGSPAAIENPLSGCYAQSR
jgi:hypothetical protein